MLPSPLSSDGADGPADYGVVEPLVLAVLGPCHYLLDRQPVAASLSATATRGSLGELSTARRRNVSAASLLRRSYTRMSNTTPSASTARQREWVLRRRATQDPY